MIYGEHTVNEDNKIVCKCGRADCFQLTLHMDMTDRAVSKYKCTNCGNVVEIHTEREMPW